MGQARKKVYERIPAEREKRFTIEQELRFYCQYYLTPYLQELLRETNNQRLLVWLATELAFEKATDHSERVFRWSSFRNSNFVFPEFLSEAEKEEFIETVLCNFCSSVCQDCESMELMETGWSYVLLNQVHCRHTYAPAPHIVAYGRRKEQRLYNPKLKSIVKHNIDANGH